MRAAAVAGSWMLPPHQQDSQQRSFRDLRLHWSSEMPCGITSWTSQGTRGSFAVSLEYRFFFLGIFLSASLSLTL